ncbi:MULTISPECIES: aminopeptidase N [Corynebacterium]|uniref:Aminopeptidase N n=1 Tax=Corynebacterium striatum TaxID=43770 RepID=A0ABX7DCX7_CORST|nr:MULTISPECIES: aminopeptidase N [Corynebacterium]KAA1262834.1 aminopeptidase N [Corynebacterium striatum]OFT63161.1 aminopeptidase N [Corynebacterium sp. HMSC05D08]QQU76495.1 aminopeptidase N [Corynebacterium striatum]HAT1277376.1 aminopeptidase N [Corynebacterium striatum]HAT1321856.1 aminopeptidase N [Corynebacterium striatum]
MTSINLTREEANARSQMIDVKHYDVHLDLTDSETHFISTTVVSFHVKQAGSTFIDLRGEELLELRLNGAPLPTNAYEAKFGVPLSGLQVADYELKVVAKIPYSHTGEGLHRFVDPADEKVYLYTQFETADAKRVFACFDQPNMKATYSLAFDAPADWTVITNGPTQTTAGANGAQTWSTEIDYPLSTYLVALCAGSYYEVTDTWTGELSEHPEGNPAQKLEVPLGVYCRASLAEHLDAERILTETKQGFDFYHRNFGFAYPFGKYDQIFVPEFNAGAMENAGCVTIRDEYVFSSKATHYKYERRADTILHELAHMWFGDLVTMEWWDDLWLNESFATWSAAISQAEETQYDTAWVTFANVEKSWAYQQDQLPTTHPISTDASDIETVEQNFDGITYAKGASVLKQLQAYVGRENFFAGVRRHFKAHAYSNATFDDLLSSLETSSGRDLSFWAQQWLKTTGINSLSVHTETDSAGIITAAELVQSGDTLRTHRVCVGLYSLQGDKVVRTDRIEMDIDGASTEIAELVGKKRADIDFILPNDDDLTYALLDLDEGSLEFLIGNIDKFEDPLARTLCWSAAWEMTRGGAMKARDFVALVARGAAAETELAVLERILQQASSAQSNYADPAWAKESTVLADALLEGTKDSDPERSIIFAQALAKIRLTDGTRAFLQDVLESSDDEGLRWYAIAALAADGALDDVSSAVDAQLARDNSATGYQAAVRARAAVNTAENKRAVWDEIVAGELTNRELTSKLEGLTYPGSDELLPTSEFFDVAEKVWSSQSSEIGLTSVTGLFPSWAISQETLDEADEFLKRDLAGGLRRSVTEQRDRMARALRNRAVDAD